MAAVVMVQELDYWDRWSAGLMAGDWCFVSVEAVGGG